METLYRKVAVSERLPKEEGEYIVKIKNFGLIERCEFFDLEDFHNDWRNDVEYWLEEITVNSPQIEKLQADKAELLSILKGLVSDVGNLIGEHDIEWQQAGYFEYAKELIQKHKQ